MFSDEEIKEIHFAQPDDEIISVREIFLGEKDYHIKKSRNVNSNVPNVKAEDPDEEQARFAWTEEDGNIASLVSEPGFGTGHATFGNCLQTTLKGKIKEEIVFPTAEKKTWYVDDGVSSTSAEVIPTTPGLTCKGKQIPKVDKSDPRSRLHLLKFIKRHGRTIKVWECGICSREFQHQYTLMRHLPTHTDERNYHCITCGKSFRQLSTLSQHRAIHSSERPYSCKQCNKNFNRVSTLISHRKTHSENKPYKCHLCPKGFHQKGNLRNHLFTHTNERPYRCNICFRGFNQQSNLVCHKNKVHPENENTEQSNQMMELVKGSESSSSNCEVSSSTYTSKPSPSNPKPSKFPNPSNQEVTPNWTLSGLGVVVDPINTYHMSVALTKKQTPFALLKPENCAPVLVKVVDAKLPGGKQVLVPATAADLRIGGKIVISNITNNEINTKYKMPGTETKMKSAVQIKVPVVATVIPKVQAGGSLQFVVEEPHHSYHTALSADSSELHTEASLPKIYKIDIPGFGIKDEPLGQSTTSNNQLNNQPSTSANYLAPSCSLPPPSLSPPLDLMPSMDLFGMMDCIPMGPQVTAVGNVEPPQSDESDIFIGEFEDCIPLSDSE